jgi:hypothetical protein
LICSKCKYKLKQGGQLLFISQKKINQISLEEEKIEKIKKNKNSVFVKSINWNEYLYNSKNLKKLCFQKVKQSLSQDYINSKLESKSPLVKALVTLFIKGELPKTDFNFLTQIQKDLISILISMKNDQVPEELQRAEKIFFIPIKRRTEENIKFIFNRAIKYMIKTFKKNLFNDAKKIMKDKFKKLGLKDKLIYAFFGYYFGEESINLGTPINQFILPKKTQGSSTNIKSHFSSISKQYLQLISINPKFLCDLRFYLTHFFMNEMLMDIIKKVQIMLDKVNASQSIRKSNDMIQRTEDLKKIIKNTHMPWNIHELAFAMEDLMGYLRL